jgi:hypothetical protein
VTTQLRDLSDQSMPAYTARAIREECVVWSSTRARVIDCCDDKQLRVRKERMAENLAVFDFQLTDDEMRSIATSTPERAAPSITAIRRW